METGWVFWEFEDNSMHTEAHAVWITSQGIWMDITPRSIAPDKCLLFLPDRRVAAKRGYTAGHRTILSTDSKTRAVEAFKIELSRIFDDCFVGMGREMEIPMSRVREAAQRVGLPADVAKQIWEEKRRNYTG